MNRQERIRQLEKLRVVKDDGRFILEKFRIEGKGKYRSSTFVIWRQVLCSTAAGALFLCSFSPAFANPFPLDLPKERLIPHKISPHLPPVGPFDQQISKDLNDHSNQTAQEKSSLPRSDKKGSEMPQSSIDQHSVQLDDPYHNNDASTNGKLEQKQQESTSPAEDSTVTEERKAESILSSQGETVNGAKLPQTATSAGSLFFQGLAIVLLGCALWKKSDINGMRHS